MLRLRSASADIAPSSLASSRGGQVVMVESYSTLQPGAYVAELASGEKIHATEAIDLSSGKSYTLICLPDAGGKRQIKLFDDGPAIASSAQRSLRVLNFADSRQTRLTIGKSAEAVVAADSVQEFKLPVGQTSVATSVLAKDGGAPAQSFAVVDLTAAAAAYLTVMPDAKGRFRPRPILGALPVPKAAPAPPAEIVEPSPEQIRSQKIAGLQMELDSYSARLSLMGPEKAGGNDAQARKELQQKISKVRAQIQSAKGGTKPASPAASPQPPVSPVPAAGN
ncbi:MAG: hypothetical protein ACKOFH_11110 [Chthoniobacterales bacterium]